MTSAAFVSKSGSVKASYRIRAESGGAGKGTRFTFTIPVAEDAGEAAATDFPRSHSRAPREGGDETRILVVDDDAQMLRFVRDALAAAGYAPLVTGDPQELPGLVKTHKPRLVLLDLVLPGTDGIQLMERVPPDWPTCRSSSSLPTAGTRRSPRRWMRERPTTSSSPSRRRSCRPGYWRPCGGGPSPNSSCWASWPSATTSAR